MTRYKFWPNYCLIKTISLLHKKHLNHFPAVLQRLNGATKRIVTEPLGKTNTVWNRANIDIGSMTYDLANHCTSVLFSRVNYLPIIPHVYYSVELTIGQSFPTCIIL